MTCLEIFKADFQSDSLDLAVVGACPSTERFNRLAWNKPLPSDSDNYSLGLIVGGHGDGNIGVWNPLKLLRSDPYNAFVARLQNYTERVRGLEFNLHSPNLLESRADQGEIDVRDMENPLDPKLFPPHKGALESVGERLENEKQLGVEAFEVYV